MGKLGNVSNGSKLKLLGIVKLYGFLGNAWEIDFLFSGAPGRTQ